ncbi:unnamed protein product [Effrenium voratum]|nr:unnamed protein product [Effrenium voratum]
MSPAGCIIEVAPESYALGCEPGKATVLRTGEHGITAVKDAEADLGFKGEWRLLLAEASPLLLPKLCGALAKTQAVLFAVKPSKAAFLCPKTQLRLAAKAVLGCGCGLRLSGTNLHPPSTSTRTQRDVGVWFRGDSRGLWRLEVGGFFVEIPGRRPGKVGPRSVEMRAACGGVILDGSRLPVIASPQRLLTEGEKLDQGWDLLCRGKYLALELEDEKRHGIWLFCGGFFGRVLGPAVGPDSVVQPDLEIEATVGEVKSPGVFQDASGLMLGSFKLEDQQLQHTLPSGEVQNWKVRGMTFNPLAEAPEVDLSEGAKVKYWSVTVQKWIPATILSKNEDGSFRLDLKKRALRCHIEPFYKAEGDAPPEAGGVTTSKKTEKKQETSSEVSSSASPSSASKAKRKAGKRKAREKEIERKEKEKQKEKSKQKRLQLEREKQRLKEKTKEKRLKEKAKEKKEEEKRLKQKAKEKKQERETKAKEKGKKKGKETKVKGTKKTGHTPKKEHGLERKSKNTNPKNKKQRKREESDQEESDQEESRAGGKREGGKPGAERSGGGQQE